MRCPPRSEAPGRRTPISRKSCESAGFRRQPLEKTEDRSAWALRAEWETKNRALGFSVFCLLKPLSSETLSSETLSSETLASAAPLWENASLGFHRGWRAVPRRRRFWKPI
ncbi:MAG: hypothetical protein LBD06_01745 [Candidatus Accumulibacter sp.]|nr:hypothetical protein [Accumulibacter sp.]